jgi:hypothetical protein
VIVRIAVRSLATRPLRTAVLAAGFGLGIAVMAELLGVGDVILEQAHAPALRGGGDVVVTGPFGSLENARFVVANVIRSRELAPRVAATSPARRGTLYLIKDGTPLAISVRGGVPSLERAIGDPEIAGATEWVDAPGDRRWTMADQSDILRAMDRFHPVPLATRASASMAAPGDGVPAAVSPRSWAEWLYFNGRSADGQLRAYLTFMTGPPGADGRRAAVVRLQLHRDGRTENYSAASKIDDRTLLRHAPDLDVAGNRVRLEGLQYRMTLALAREQQTGLDGQDRRDGQDGRRRSVEVWNPLSPRSEAATRPTLVGTITLEAIPGRSLPPASIQGAHGWVTGYVVPVLSGAMRGTLVVDGQPLSLDGLTGYHDHNWGFWEGVRWRWGQAASGDVSIIYGRIFPPPTVADPNRMPGFLGVLGPNGPIAFSTDVTIDEQDANSGPRALTIVARSDTVDLRLAFLVEETVRTALALTNAAGSPAMDFLQLGGTYQVRGRAGDRELDFTSRGSAETFRPAR